MADDTIQLPPDSTGPFIDTESLTVGLNTVHRERHQIAGDSATDIAPVTAADGLLVNLGTNNDVVDTAAEASLAVIDDWDESDRAKVNPIAGQAGVQGGAGAVTALTQRVVVATDQTAIPVSGTVAVTGSATLAEQQTQTGHLSQIEIAVEILDNAIAGSEMQVDVVAALPAGTNNIGDVDVLTVPAPLNLVGGGVEAAALRVTLASDSTGLVSVDDNGGSLTVDGTVAVTGVSTLAEQQTQTTHLATIAGDTTAIETAIQILDDWDESDRAKVNPIVGVAGVAAGAGAVSTTVQRVTLASDDPAVTALQILDNIVAGSEAQVDVITLPALVAGSANIGDVDIASVAAGTVMEVVGDVASDAAVPANPVIIGGRASTAQPTPVSADGDSVNLWTNRKGSPIVAAAPHVGLLNDPWALTGETAQYTTTQTSAVLVAGGASERIVVTKVQIQVGGTTAGTVQLYFGTGAYARGTNLAIFDGEFAPSATLKPGVVMDGPFVSAANGDDLLVTTSAAINPITFTVWYYIIT